MKTAIKADIKVEMKPEPSRARSNRKLKSGKRTSKKFQCEKCDKFLSSEKHFKKHLAKVHLDKTFICDFEGKTFNTKDKLRLHIFQHRKYFKVNCEVCDKQYKTNQSMRKHLRTHFENHQCETCGHNFKYKRLLQNHISSLHSDDPKIPCNYCTRLFPNTTTRDAHQKTIHKDQQVNTGIFKCSECPQGFEMKEELRIHSFIHFQGEIHTCCECHQIFKKKKLLNNHMRKHESASFNCNKCGLFFKYRSNLGKHLKEGRCKGPVKCEAQDDPSPEEVAEKAKSQLMAMTVNPSRVHIKGFDFPRVKKATEIKQERPERKVIVHTVVLRNDLNLRPLRKTSVAKTTAKPSASTRKPKVKNAGMALYECDLCDFSTPFKCKLLSHIRFHVASKRHKCKQCDENFKTRMHLHNHSMKIHGRGVIGSVEYSSKSEECPICHRMFSAERMKYHMKLHEASLFSCDKCSKKFRQESTLEKHILTNHLGEERKYICSVCSKAFRKLTVLKQHEETHNPFKIYVQCELCLTLLQMKSLKLHMEIKHGDRYSEKTHVCDCGKAFRYAKQLDKHIEAVHQKVNRGIIYPCASCDLVFNRRIELREHSFEHYEGKIFLCDCGMRFKKQKLLTIHSVVHANDEWPCDVCTLSFKTRGGRRKHKAKVHSQEAGELVEIPCFETAEKNK